ncbi:MULTISPECIES: acetylornithine deacetylase/succinyl-diaminopimelate desuccinylase family protein [Halocynthiibacter]|uniref:Acetylornithine deacetylase/succinyl-diaminopimelate desuccinylase family protein n=1 Tax=Halocynthiibacter halioticoli TaxID=2986804 RepID=A0AAE3LQL4_9RHOB|nr:MULTISPECIES: acetylornithine deacetylase/succinyl-diaminopimelate desuccinylase family protein [Halocynthiibacter]MCV6823663.1 acetylornithine deacetylase/succinyl-diaminopimelate desuccinylase family protein [Halocynthiibacter halioticoli]MCW4056664.1 acetylornithine deacetylase/succinyl-diaminopimelate desuccinylase family protein [Halocynthiibacter sp. SDUM655004]
MDYGAKLDAEIEARRDDLIALTQDLIRIPTLNPPGDCYLEICEYLRDRLATKGFDVQLVRAEGAIGDSDKYPRWNVVARREGAHSGECVHFNSHTDVVEVGRDWTYDPFGGELDDGKIYGRGACDMKGGLATSIIAAEVFVDLFPEFSGAVEISGTADEESGGYGGVAYLAEKGFFAPERVQHVIIPEPLNKDRICLGHRGVWWAELETFGEIAHGSMPFLGDCAVRHMGAVVHEMEQSLFPALAEKRTDMPVVPEGAKQSTLNINSMHGGMEEPEADYTGYPSACVPDSCRMVLDRRFLIEEDIKDVQAEIQSVLDKVKAERDTFRYDLREMHRVLPTMTEKDAPVVTTVAEAIQDIIGAPAEYVVSPGTYDQKHIDRIGKLKNCIAYGPGILDLAHKPDEYIGVEDMVDSAKVMARSLVKILLGHDEITVGEPKI